jgi:hypothetical protein
MGGLDGLSCGIFRDVGTAAVFIATMFIRETLAAAFFGAKLGIVNVAVIAIVGGAIVAGGYLVARFAGERLAGAKVGRHDGSWLTVLGAKIRKNGLLLDLALAQSGEIVGYGFFFVESDLAGVGADEPFVEDAAGELIEVFVFEGAQHAGADLGGVGDGVELKSTLLALSAKFFSEGAHLLLLLSSARINRATQ